MGWSFGWQGRRELIEYLVERDFSWSKDDGNSCRVVRHCCAGNNLWMVVERRKPGGESHRYVALCLMQRSGGQWGYKDMDESCGPSAVNCPLSYLEDAPLVDAGHAKAWRERVRAHWERERAGREAAKSLAAGSVFKSSASGKEMEFQREYSRTHVVALERATGRLFRVRKADVMALGETPAG